MVQRTSSTSKLIKKSTGRKITTDNENSKQSKVETSMHLHTSNHKLKKPYLSKVTFTSLLMCTSANVYYMVVFPLADKSH